MSTRNYRNRETGRIWAGLFLLMAGATLILHEEGLFIPDTIYNWHLLIAGIGLFLGLARNFRGLSWLVITAIGAVGLAEDYYSAIHIEPFVWPAVIIVIGLLLLFRRRRPWEEEWEAKWRQRKMDWEANRHQWHQTKREWKHYARKEWREAIRDKQDHWRFGAAEQSIYSEDQIDIASSFGAFRKKVRSKNFRGGYVVTFAGDLELDLMEADFYGTIKLNLTQIMGSTTILVPDHWEVRADVNSVFADFKDRRDQPAMTNPEKVLVLSGKSIFGNIDIKNRPFSATV